jgi:regulator of cell morphogenesis and NO signaling
MSFYRYNIFYLRFAMNFPNLTIQSEVRNFATQNPQHAIKTFKSFGIDFCCGGKKSLSLVCSQKGLDPYKIFDQLNQPSAHEPLPIQKNWDSLSLPELVENILVNHHFHMREVLPELTQTMKKVLKAHGLGHPELQQLSKTLQALRDDLEPHMLREEAILFPIIQKLGNGNSASEKVLRQIRKPIQVMTEQHEDLGNLLKTMRELTNNYFVPDDACNTFIYLYKELEALENDLFIHTHKENNILFPKVLNAQKIAAQTVD